MIGLATPVAAPSGPSRRDVDAPRLLGAAAAALLIVSEFKLRTRDPAAALSGDADGQVVLEIAASAGVALWLSVRRAARSLAGAGAPAGDGTPAPVQVLRLTAMTALVSSFWSPTSIAPVRAVQLVVVVELAAELAQVCRAVPSAADDAVAAFRTVLLAAVAAAAVCTFALPQYQPFVGTYQGVDRFRLLAMHPLSTGIVLSLLALLLLRPAVQAWAARRGPASAPAAARWGAVAGPVAAAGVVATHQRSVAVGFVLALLVLVVCSTDRRQRQLAALAGAVVLVAVLTVLSDLLEAYLRRGQSDDQLASLSGRADLLATGADLFRDAPAFGHGYLSGRSVFLADAGWAGESHNLLVEVAVSTGTLGLVLLAALGVTTWRSVRDALRTTEEGTRAVAVDAASCLVLLVSLAATTDSVAGPPRAQVVSLALLLAVLPQRRAARDLSGR